MLMFVHYKITMHFVASLAKRLRRAATESHADLCINAAVTQRPGFTRVLAHGTHDGGVGFADLFAGRTEPKGHVLSKKRAKKPNDQPTGFC